VCSDQPWTSVHGRLYNIYYTDVHATGPGHPLCRRLAAVQPSRWLAEVGRQVMAREFNWPGRVGGSVSLSQMCGLQTRLLRTRIRNYSRDLRTDPHRSFTKIRGRGRARILQKSNFGQVLTVWNLVISLHNITLNQLLTVLMQQTTNSVIIWPWLLTTGKYA